MALDDLLSKMEGRAVETADTACNGRAVSVKHPLIGACTADTSDTAQNTNADDWAQFFGWLFHFTDRDDLPVRFAPAVDHAKALSCYPDAVAAEPIPVRPQRVATEAEAKEIMMLIGIVFANDTDVDRSEALAAALADPDGALRCYRAIAEERGIILAETDDDRRTCSQCLNLRGRVCTVAKPGGLVSANVGYQPAPDTLQRCAGYLPNTSDHDQRPGRERWPVLP